MTLENAPKPTMPYSTTKLVSFEYFATIDNYDITVENIHEFYAEGINVKNCMGKYHPHGDASIYDTMTKMVADLAVPLIDGSGNFGTLTDSPAASRYTEVRLSRYSDLFMLDKDYINVTTMLPNYDGSEKEPLILPALLPNLFLNGGFGIAMGFNSGFPPMKLEPLIPLIERVLNKKEVSVKLFKKHIDFNYPYGGIDVSTEEATDQWLNKGSGPLRFDPKYEINFDTRTIVVSQVPPFFNWDNVANRLAKQSIGKGKLNFISNFGNEVDRNTAKKGGKSVKFVVRIKNTVPRDEIKKRATQVMEVFANSVNMASNVVKRVGEDNIEFVQSTIPNLLTLWVEYRVDLEQRVQQYKIDLLQSQIARQKLLKFAVENRKIITSEEVLGSQKPIEILAKKLKVSDEVSKELLHLQVLGLSRINGDEVDAKIVVLKKDTKTAENFRDHPEPKVLSDINLGLTKLSQKIS